MGETSKPEAWLRRVHIGASRYSFSQIRAATGYAPGSVKTEPTGPGGFRRNFFLN